MSTGIIFETLKRSKETKELIGVYDYSSDEAFWSATVYNFNDDLVALQHYTKYGQPDGLQIRPLETIKSIDFNDNYSRAMSYLVSQAKMQTKEELTIELTQEENWQAAMLKQAEGNPECVVDVYFGDDDPIIGFVERVTETDFLMRALDGSGVDDGVLIYRTEDVSVICFNSMQGWKRRLLYNWRASLKDQQ